MTPEQKVIYDQMRAQLENEEFPLNKLSDNHVMRFLQSLLWDFDETLSYLRNSENLRREYEVTVLYEEQFLEELSWNAFVYNGLHDRAGRPLFFIKWANWLPVAGTEM